MWGKKKETSIGLDMDQKSYKGQPTRIAEIIGTANRPRAHADKIADEHIWKKQNMKQAADAAGEILYTVVHRKDRMLA